MRRFSDDERRARLAHRHRLTPSHPADDVADVVKSLVALHSSDPATVFLSAAIRMKSPSIEAVERALYVERSLVRHHAFRRTLWVMTPEVAGWAHASATTKIAAAERRKLVAFLDECPDVADPIPWLEAAFERIEDLLRAEGPLGTRAIGKLLPELAVPLLLGAGTNYEQTVAAHGRVMLQAGFEGRLVRTRPSGGWTASEYAWMPMNSWLGHALPPIAVDAGSAAFLSRWLQRFGPATEDDIAWWTGWTRSQVRRALHDAAAVPVELESGRPGWIDQNDDDVDGGHHSRGRRSRVKREPWVRLLPALDPTVMGWKERSWYVDAEVASRVFDRSGNAGPTVWVDGRVVGGWAQCPDGSIGVEVLRSLDPPQQRALERERERMADLIGEVRVRVRFPAPNQKDLLA